jgi:hypothetical protein
LVEVMRPALCFFLVALTAVSLAACEPTPKVASPDQPCNCAASRGDVHHSSGRTEISR